MKQLSRVLVLICVLALMGFSVGCDGGNAGGCGNWQVDPTPTPDPGTEDPPVLDQLHSGWQNPNCLACHPSSSLNPDVHESDSIPAHCAECHGENGARLPNKSYHNEAANCNSCHKYRPSDHTASLFPWDSCWECHNN